MLDDLQQQEGIALIGTGSDANNFASEYSSASREKRKTDSSFSPVLLFACGIISLLCLILNGAQLLSAANRHNAVPASLPRLDVHSLQRPSLYLGLDRVPNIQVSLLLLSQLVHPTATAHSPAAEPARPTLAALSSGKPYATVRLNHQRPNLEFPRDGWVLLTEEDHTVLAFNLPPTGSSSCTFSSHFPPRNELKDRLLTIEGPGSDSLVQITSLPSPASLNLSSLTWNNRPAAGPVLAVLHIGFGVNETAAAFHCTPGDSLVVELACLGEGCRIEYQEVGEPSRLGIELQQI